MKTTISKHAMCQIKKRMHVTEEEAIKIVQKAWECGRKTNEFTGGIRESLIGAVQAHPGTTSLRLYKGMRFVFSKDALLITVYKDYRKPSKGDRRSYRMKPNHHNIKAYEQLKWINLLDSWADEWQDEDIA